MKSVIFIDKENKEEEKPVEFTHYSKGSKWEAARTTPSDYEKVVYLGKDVIDGDLFACYEKKGTYICIHKGHLNSGKY